MKIILMLLCFIFNAHSKVEVRNNKIVISNDRDFESKLEMKNFEITENEASLTVSGFIVASAQYNFENDRFVNKWVSLEDKVLKANNVILNEVKPVKDLVYGVISTSKEYEKNLRIGQELFIERYGIKGDHFVGKIIKLIPLTNQDYIQIHFLAKKAPELIAGTTCEVKISNIKKRAFTVSLLSILHLGLEDYIVIKEADGIYSPKRAVVLEQNSDNATILVNVTSSSKYVARGAILLKPLIDEIIKDKGLVP